MEQILFPSTEYKDLSEETISELISFGVDFQIAFDCFLKHERFSLNKKFRDFIRTILWQNKDGQFKAKDKDLALILDCTRETVSRTRKRFCEWQQFESINLIEIKEGEYLRDETGQLAKNQDGRTAFVYTPTEYKITFGKILIKAVINARNSTLYSKNHYKAIKTEIDLLVSDVAMNPKIIKRKQKKFRQVSDEHNTARKRFVNEARKCMQFAEAQRDLSLESELEVLHEILESVFENLIGEYDGKLIPSLERQKRDG